MIFFLKNFDLDIDFAILILETILYHVVLSEAYFPQLFEPQEKHFQDLQSWKRWAGAERGTVPSPMWSQVSFLSAWKSILSPW